MALQASLQKALDHLQKELAALHTGRASASLVEHVEVESYGAMTPLKNVANVSCPDSQTIRIEPWDKGIVGEVEKSLQRGDFGSNPQNMGDYIILPIPPMTEERRRDIVKLVHKEKENAKIAIRNARQDEMKDIKHMKDEKEISEDEYKNEEESVQKQVDEANSRVDEMAQKKESDVMSI